MKKTIKMLLAAGLISAAVTSCSKDDEAPEVNDNEVITTVRVKAVATDNTKDTLTFNWKDADGDGPGLPVIDPINLKAGKVYNVHILLLDETKTPVDNVTEEVESEGHDHRFYFDPSGANITVSDLDKDKNNVSLGLQSKWTTIATAASGTIKITLRHYPNGGKSETDLVNSTKSSTDAEAVFPLNITL
ncbi:hypothetical protein [Filimonas effusa]|uniref:Type 1 periplasmic binding fold superfamily protein n=1 Tax=Filimonas effusa TaxID=2508721 RepID=A0A4Q1D0R8_9BACT|nr:hypothetical protein [Filimonas effusa]RXK81329.1 hypothetical protein ESB13_20550 [Filimonas effusa]